MQVKCALVLALCLTLGWSAPIDDYDAAHRDSTKQILNLEQELKQRAGEDKKFFPNNKAGPLPQIDGLDNGDVDLGGPDGEAANKNTPESIAEAIAVSALQAKADQLKTDESELNKIESPELAPEQNGEQYDEADAETQYKNDEMLIQSIMEQLQKDPQMLYNIFPEAPPDAYDTEDVQVEPEIKEISSENDKDDNASEYKSTEEGIHEESFPEPEPESESLGGTSEVQNESYLKALKRLDRGDPEVDASKSKGYEQYDEYYSPANADVQNYYPHHEGSGEINDVNPEQNYNMQDVPWSNDEFKDELNMQILKDYFEQLNQEREEERQEAYM